MRLLIILIPALLLSSCIIEDKADRPLYYKTKLERAEIIYAQTERTLKRIDELSAQVLEVYALVKELHLRTKLYESSRCACSLEALGSLAESP